MSCAVPSRSSVPPLEELLVAANTHLNLLNIPSKPPSLESLIRNGALAISERFGTRLAYLFGEHAEELTSTPQTGRIAKPKERSLFEGFTEFFRRYIVDPDGALRDYPTFYSAFDDFLDSEAPGLLQTLEGIQLHQLRKDLSVASNPNSVPPEAGNDTTSQRAFSQMTRRVYPYRKWSALAAMLFLIGALVWVHRPDSRERWIRHDGTLACPNESEIVDHQIYTTPSGRRRSAEEAVTQQGCFQFLAKERVRIDILSNDGSRARISASRGGGMLWVAVTDLVLSPPR